MNGRRSANRRQKDTEQSHEKAALRKVSTSKNAAAVRGSVRVLFYKTKSHATASQTFIKSSGLMMICSPRTPALM